MATTNFTRIFNFTNQKLNANKLREVEAFTSDNFGGIISDDYSSPFEVSGNTITLNASTSNPVTFLGAGSLLNQVESESATLANGELWYLAVELDDSVSTITTDELKYTVENSDYSKITFNKVSCSNIKINSTYTYYTPVYEATGSPADNQYYEYSNGTYTLSSESTVDPDITYYHKIESSRITFKASWQSVYSYFGNTLWINNKTFIIPLFINDNGNIVQAVIIRSLSDFENLLSLQSYAALKAYVDGNFVWTSGGMDLVTDINGNTHRKGDVGKLNITDDTIYSTVNTSNPIPDYDAPVKIQSLTVNNLANEANDLHTKLVVGTNGHISVKREYIQPVNHGGTGADNRKDAKTNLGIYYGTKVPTSGSYMEGDIFLCIVE